MDDVGPGLSSELERIREEFQRLIGESRALTFQCHKWFYSERADDPETLLNHIEFFREMLREHFQAVSVLAARAGAAAPDHRPDGRPEGPHSRIPPAWPAVPHGPKH